MSLPQQTQEVLPSERADAPSRNGCLCSEVASEVRCLKRAVQSLKNDIVVEFSFMKESLQQLQRRSSDAAASSCESTPEPSTSIRQMSRPLPSPGSSKLLRHKKVQTAFNEAFRQHNELVPAQKRISKLSDIIFEQAKVNWPQFSNFFSTSFCQIGINANLMIATLLFLSRQQQETSFERSSICF